MTKIFYAKSVADVLIQPLPCSPQILMSEPAIVEIFANLSDKQRKTGKSHDRTLCLALFTLTVAAGNQEF